MLATILPGLREARVPLAAGVLWLLAIYIATSWLLPGVVPTLLFVQVRDMSGVLGVAVILTGLAFAAYLLGVVVLSLPVFRPTSVSTLKATSISGLDERIRREIKSARLRGVSFERLSAQFAEVEQAEDERYRSDADRESNAQEMLSENPETRMSLDSISDHDRWLWLDEEDPIGMIRRRVLSDLELAELSLQATTKDVYDKYDRARAEGEFRQAVSFPLVAIVAALGIRLSLEYENPWLLLSLLLAVPAAFLYFSGRQHLSSARDLMVQAVLAGQATSPTLKLIADLQPALKRA